MLRGSFFKKFLLDALSLVHSMLDVFTSDHQAQDYFSVAMEGSMKRFIRAIRELSKSNDFLRKQMLAEPSFKWLKKSLGAFDELKTENEVKGLLTYEEWIRNKPNRITRQVELSYLTSVTNVLIYSDIRIIVKDATGTHFSMVL